MDEDKELKGLLLETLQLTRENNRMLRGMRRDATIGRIVSFVWWLVILGIPLVLYYFFLMPYITQVTSLYENASAQGGQLIDSSGVKGLLDFLGGAR
jgi:uncharacterized membrane protein